MIKEVNDKHWELERSHMKKLYEKEAHITGVENYYMDSEYVKGEFKLNKPDWWLEDLSFSYKRSTKIDLFEEIATQCAEVRQKQEKCAEVRQKQEKCAEMPKSAPCEQKVHNYAPNCEKTSTEITLQSQEKIGMPNSQQENVILSVNPADELITSDERKLNKRK
jgi:hypothetical protein